MCDINCRKDTHGDERSTFTDNRAGNRTEDSPAAIRCEVMIGGRWSETACSRVVHAILEDREEPAGHLA